MWGAEVTGEGGFSEVSSASLYKLGRRLILPLPPPQHVTITRGDPGSGGPALCNLGPADGVWESLQVPWGGAGQSLSFLSSQYSPQNSQPGLPTALWTRSDPSAWHSRLPTHRLCWPARPLCSALSLPTPVPLHKAPPPGLSLSEPPTLFRLRGSAQMPPPLRDFPRLLCAQLPCADSLGDRSVPCLSGSLGRAYRADSTRSFIFPGPRAGSAHRRP